MDKTRLKEIKERCETANTVVSFEIHLRDGVSRRWVVDEWTRAFTSKAMTDIPDLVAEVERLQAKLERCQMFAQTWKDLVSTYKEENKRLKEFEWMYNDLCK